MNRSIALETLAAKWIASHPADAQRIIRGLQLAKTPGAVLCLASSLYRVKGSTESYHVTPGACDCADATFRGTRCKHRWAASLTARVDAQAPKAQAA